MDFEDGEVIADKYEIKRVLGRGGMGVVYAARHRELGELVALKFLLPSRAAIPEAATRFLREARAGTRIKSEHVARVFDVGTAASGAPFMVMEHLRRRTRSGSCLAISSPGICSWSRRRTVSRS